MDPERARSLGAYLQQQRQSCGLSQRQLAEATGVHHSQLQRIELGSVSSPRADVLAHIADRLGLDIADVYGMAGYAAPSDLPAFKPYLRAKYSELPDNAVTELANYFDYLASKYGSHGPAAGEDER